MSAAASLASLFLAATGSFPDSAVLALLDHSYGREGSESLVCLQIDGNDPSDAMLAAVARRFPFVIKESECPSSTAGNDATGGPKRGRLWLSDFHESPPGVASARVGAHFGRLAAGTWTVRLVKSDAGWSVTSVENEVIY